MIELNNTSVSKYRYIAFNTDKSSIEWNSDQPVSHESKDAITRHLELFFSLQKPMIDYNNVAQSLEMIEKALKA
jgi:hypothetical protein